MAYMFEIVMMYQSYTISYLSSFHPNLGPRGALKGGWVDIRVCEAFCAAIFFKKCSKVLIF